MIVAKPIPGTLFSFIGFVVIGVLLITMSLIQIVNSQASWYTYLTIIVLGPLCALVLYKMIFNYKVVQFEPRKITIRYTLKKITKALSPQQVVSWQETTIKTGKTSTFKELEIRFATGTRIKLGHREYTNYDQVVLYLKKNAGNKEQLPL